MVALALKLGANPRIRIWRQNVGGPIIRDERGKARGKFNSGPPKGAADLSGCVCPDGWRLEIETKSAKRCHTEEQQAFARVMRECGCVYVLARYDDSLSLEANVELGAGTVMSAIAERALRQ